MIVEKIVDPAMDVRFFTSMIITDPSAYNFEDLSWSMIQEYRLPDSYILQILWYCISVFDIGCFRIIYLDVLSVLKIKSWLILLSTFAMSGALAWQVKKINKKFFYWFLGERSHGIFCPGPLPRVLCASFPYASFIITLRYYLHITTLHATDSLKIYSTASIRGIFFIKLKSKHFHLEFEFIF